MLVDALSLIRPLCADAIYQISQGAVSFGGAQLLQGFDMAIAHIDNSPQFQKPALIMFVNQ